MELGRRNSNSNNNLLLVVALVGVVLEDLGDLQTSSPRNSNHSKLSHLQIPGYSQDASTPLIPINKIAESYGPDAKFIAGVNGGYFWRTDITGFWFDDVCRGKTRKQAETPVDDCTAHPDNGLHDGSLIVDGKSVGCNCNNWGYSRPALMATTEGNAEWNIMVMSRGEQAAAGVKFALAAGPNLVSYDPVTGQSKVDIPDGEDNINRFEHAAQTAVGINFASAGVANKITMVTTDGCEYSSKCGVADPNLALLKFRDGLLIG